MKTASLLEQRRKLGRPFIMGHRGACGHAPENTMASFLRAQQIGVDAVELDCHLSKDGHLIVMHDEALDRTTNGKGLIAAHTRDEIKRLDAGSHFSAEFAGEPVPTLEEVLRWAKDSMPVIIEVKPGLHTEPLVEACIALVERLGVADQVAFISFDHFVPRGIKKHKPHFAAGVLYHARVVDPVSVAGAALADGVLPHFSMLRPDLAPAMHAEEKWVGTWTPNTEEELRFAIEMGADMIGTNYPDRLRKVLGL